MKRIIITLALLLSAAVPAFAQATAGATFIYGQYQWFDNNGTVLSGGKICTFAAGSATPHSTWSDSGLSVLNTNPVILNSGGRASIYLDGTNYKIQVLSAGTDNTCATGTTIYTQDNVEDLANVFFNTKVTANTIYAGPSTGSPAIPAFRVLGAADLPNTIVTTTSTGIQANFAPGLVSNYTTILCNNATLLEITGIAGGTAGQRVRFVSKGAGIVSFAHQNVGSTAANRLINDATSADTSLQAGVGAAEYTFDGVTQRWRLTFHNQGGWITRTFSAGNFTGNGGMTWTVAGGFVSRDAYLLQGNTLLYSVVIVGSTIGGAPSTALQIAIPSDPTGGAGHQYTAAAGVIQRQASVLTNNNVGSVGMISAAPGATLYQVFLDAVGATNWTASANTAVETMVSIEVQ